MYPGEQPGVFFRLISSFKINNAFYIPEIPYLRIKINIKNGKAISLVRQYNEGSDLENPKD